MTVSPLKRHIGFWMRIVSNHVSHAFARKVEAHGVTVAEWVILREMFDLGPTSPSELAEKTGLTRGAISKLVERLLQKDLLSRVVAEGDRRYQEVALTAKGTALVPKLAHHADENDEEFFRVLTAAERKQLKDLLLKIVSRHELTTLPTE